jgi:hypothetical protein
MTDGSGYVDGLSGDTIPVGARILAVADAFDAMQRPTAFREPMSAQQAASEVVRAKGMQFDPDAVDAFVRVVSRRGLWTGALKEKVRLSAKRQVGQPPVTAGPEQPTLDDSVVEGRTTPSETGPAGATPGEGMKYTEVRGEIEKDILEWERSEIDRPRQRTRGEPGRRAARKKKDQEGEGPRNAEDA